MKISKKTKMIKLLQEHPEASKILESYDLACAKCLGAIFEDLESAARANDIKLKELIKELNNLNKDN